MPRSLACVLLIVLSLQAARAESADEFVQRLVSAITATSAAPAPQAKLEAQLRSQLPDFVNIAEMARRAIKDDWGKLDESTREKYLAAYRSFLARALLRHIGGRPVRHVVHLGVRTLENGAILVQTRVILVNDKEHDVQWYIQRLPKQLVVDLALDGVLASETQWREFQVILKVHDGDLTALPAALEKLTP